MADSTSNQGAQLRAYRKKDLMMKQNVPGARMWAVALEKSMLTYFEMEPATQFPEHSHEAEQITLVLEGELTFVSGAERLTLGPGDVIAIPSNKIHAVISGKVPCKAVDAWSPVRREYL